MVFRDAIFRNKRSEPWWFGTMRRIIALSFIFLLLIYGLSRLKDVAAFLNSPNIIVVEHKNVANFPGFIICPESSSPEFIIDNESQVDPQFSITCGFSTIIGPEILSENMNIADNDCSSLISKAENGCLRFQPGDKYVDSINDKDDSAAYNQDFGNGEIPLKSLGFNQSLVFFNIKPNIESEIPSFYTLYFEDYIHQETDDEPIHYSVKDFDNYFIEYTNVLINSGQKNIIEYTINTHKTFSSSLIGLINIVPDLYTMEIKFNTKYIQSKETQFILLPKLPHFFRQEIEKFEYHPISLISTIGGFHSAIIAFYLLLFGMPRIEPWGFLQKYLLRFWCLRGDFKRTLANDYNTEPGIPLVENIEDIPKEISLEDRVQNLEYLLKDNYFDSYCIEELKDEVSKYDYQKDFHEKLENFLLIRNNNSVTSDTSLTIQVPSLDDHNYIDLNLSSPFTISVISEDGKKSPLSSFVFNID